MTPPPVAPPPTDPVWNDAHQRVESYLRAHRIAHPLALSRLTTAIVARAWEAAAARPHDNPVTLAMREADTTVTAWFARMLAHTGPHSRRLGTRGRLALALADVPGRWPGSFLAEGEPPSELTAEMREAFLNAGPHSRPAKMAPRPIDLGLLAAAAARAWQVLEHSGPLRVLRPIVLLAAGVAAVVLALRT